MRIRFIKYYILVTLLTFAAACKQGGELNIISGSENKALEPILADFTDDTGITVNMTYKGSVDIMLMLQQGQVPFDAVWPANSLWVAMGDKGRKVKHEKSIMASPVVFGIRQSLARELGFVGKDVRVADILAAIRAGKLSFMMTSATQSNSGASAYIGFLYALLGNPEFITKQDLYRGDLKTNIRSLLAGINRGSGSSGWLKDLFLKASYDAMVNYEALIIEANQELIQNGREPLHVVYPVDGIVMADSPLGYVDQGDPKKEQAFLKLQEYLLSEKVQQRLAGLGRRTGFGGVMGEVDPAIFNPQWGIDAKKILTPIKLPPGDVIFEALNLYQVEYRKPSLTIFCLDYSGSMAGEGAQQLKQAMNLLLNEARAKQYMLQAGSDDQFIVLPFSHELKGTWRASGKDAASMNALNQKIQTLEPVGGTDIYAPVVEALDLLVKTPDLDKYIPAIIVLSDGESNVNDFDGLADAWRTSNRDVPVFSILFGEASEDQLKEISDLTRARLFDGRKDLISAFRKVKGYN